MSAVVVGTGIVGSSVAYHLASRGVPVTLLDQGPAPAAGVTGDSFAWIGGCGGDWPGGARDLRGSVLADYRRLEAELPHVAVRWTGSLAWTRAQGQRDSPLGPGRFRVGRSDIAALEPNLRNPPEQAVHTPSDGGVDPAALTNALVDAARARGATVIHNSVVTSLKMTGERVEGVLSATGFHAATTVVLAAGTGIPKLCEPLLPALPVAASAAHLVRLTAPAHLVRSIVAGPDLEVREVRDGDLVLTLPQVEDMPTASSEQAAQEALRRLRAAFRGSDSCRLLGSRIGRRPMPSQGPAIGYLTQDRSVYVAVMHSAITLAPTVGRLVADELVSGRPAPELRRCRPRGLTQW
ncbi:NAD(P)/FAD-dependent oxidoreductase [Streptomyces fuscichromogenes]|uniref:D-amino-acid oxidase n=1 Tax=Streptomyces fuscichromogenes TaxID=1324013 RepID=A0A918CPL7_9ACTN|nr:FAD-dependent oxidoreductase [Streptomyces fuscichromogenes]GGM97659.1 D-amino-acid oxidase [Streptomyces fuscichromogenes]